MSRKKLLIRFSAILLVVLLVASFTTFTACGEKEPEVKTLRIGALFALTGWFSSFDLISTDIAEITRDMIF